MHGTDTLDLALNKSIQQALSSTISRLQNLLNRTYLVLNPISNEVIIERIQHGTTSVLYRIRMNPC
jgi:hypothetical protein